MCVWGPINHHHSSTISISPFFQLPIAQNPLRFKPSSQCFLIRPRMSRRRRGSQYTWHISLVRLTALSRFKMCNYFTAGAQRRCFGTNSLHVFTFCLLSEKKRHREGTVWFSMLFLAEEFVWPQWCILELIFGAGLFFYRCELLLSDVTFLIQPSKIQEGVL